MGNILNENVTVNQDDSGGISKIYGKPLIDTYGRENAKRELSEIRDAISELNNKIDSLLADKEGEVDPIVEDDKINYDLFSYGGYTIGSGIVNRTNRAYTIIKNANPVKITFDGDKFGINYYIVGQDDIGNLISSPDAWNTSGTVIFGPSLKENEALIIVSKRVGNLNFDEESINELNKSIIYRNI